ncbi:MAG TPA: MFS transporter, partial [Gammaproteobacteria bacterium]|nr:MFS transporter [Gammaproteobacteria bacterium]
TSVDEPKRARGESAPAAPLRTMLGALDRDYWLVVSAAALFTLARFSEAFLILKAAADGVAAAAVPLVLVTMNVAYSLCAYPAGKWSDRVSRWAVLGIGSAVLVAADAVLAYSGSIAGAFLGIALWGMHLGFTQGLFSALVADASSPEQRGTAFGIFHLVTGFALLTASALAGVLWDRLGPAATFLVGAALAAVSAGVAFLLYSRK